MRSATFLGTGTSTGVPLIGCACPTCTSADPRDNRLRPSLLLKSGEFHLLVDTSPDFRQQVFRHRVERVDAVLITHPHVDHLFGLDDLRRFNLLQKSAIPVHATPETIQTIHAVFAYLFVPAIPGTFLPNLEFVPVDGPFDVGPFHVTPFDVSHGLCRTTGYRFDAGDGASLAYVPDCKVFPESAYAAVGRPDVMILDALKPAGHPSHLSFGEAFSVLGRIGAPRSYITHIGHDLLHKDIPATPSRLPAYDGLTVSW